MKTKREEQSFFIKIQMPIMLLLAFGLWIFCMRGFILNKFTFLKDALSYYEHTKFFIENMAKGILPLWDPNWNCGVSNEFFLRRIGMYNPAYFFLVFLVKIGIPYTQAYITFLVSYYFLGMVGFYLVVNSILNNRIAAFTAFCLLMFSSQGTLIFSSFVFLLFTPMIWFFYFLIRFSRQPQKFSAYGITLTTMILFSTYIPFYFLAVFLSFLILYCILFFDQLPKILKNYFTFIKTHKLLSLLCIAAIIIAIIPGFLFMQKAGSNEFILPSRHYESPDNNTLTVKPQIIAEGGIIADAILKRMLLYLEKFKTGIVYMPIFAYLLVLLSFGQKINRKIVLVTLWGFVFFMSGLYETSPIYPFLYKHIFFFKYFRNFQFFIWILLLPLFAFLGAIHLNIFIERISAQKKKNFIVDIIFVSLVHLGFTIFLLTQPHVIISSFYVIFFSWITLISLALHTGQINKSYYWLIVFLILCVGQPLQVFNYLNQNSTLKTGSYGYDAPYMDFKFNRFINISDKSIAASNDEWSTKLPERPTSVYYATSPYHILRQSINYPTFTLYTNNKFYIYDQIELVATEKFDLKQLEISLKTGENKAYIWSNDFPFTDQLKNEQKTSLTLTENSAFLDIIHYDANSIQLLTHFTDPKFLVYTDNFYKGWKLLIDNKPAHLYQANFSFKGFFVPAGDHTISLKFENKRTYIYNYLILELFLMIFILLLWETIVFKSKGANS